MGEGATTIDTVLSQLGTHTSDNSKLSGTQGPYITLMEPLAKRGKSYIESNTLQRDTGSKRSNRKYQDRRENETHVSPSASQMKAKVVTRFRLIERMADNFDKVEPFMILRILHG